MGWFEDLRGRYDGLLETYGKVAIGVYFTLFFGTWFGFWLAMQAGFDASGWGASAASIGGAYVATKLTQPLRIGATLVLTPAVGWVVQRLGGAPSEAPTPPPPTSTT